MKALLNLFSFLFQLGSKSTASPGATSQTAEKLDFELLKVHDQEAIRRYFAATVDLMSMVEDIRKRKRAVNIDNVLTAFREAERGFIHADMRPIFPPAVHGLTEFNAEYLIRRGMLARLGTSETPMIYSRAMDKYVAKLIVRFAPCELDTDAFNPLVKV